MVGYKIYYFVVLVKYGFRSFFSGMSIIKRVKRVAYFACLFLLVFFIPVYWVRNLRYQSHRKLTNNYPPVILLYPELYIGVIVQSRRTGCYNGYITRGSTTREH